MNNQDDTFFSLDEAWDAGIKNKVVDLLGQKSAKLRALGILDKIDEAGKALGVTPDKIQVATYMRDNKIFDEKEAVEKLYSKTETEVPVPETPTPVTKDNLAAKVHEAVGGDEDVFNPEELLAGLSAKLYPEK